MADEDDTAQWLRMVGQLVVNHGGTEVNGYFRAADEILRLRSDNQKLREALLRIAFGGASGEVNDLAGNPMLWSSTTAYLALGGRIEGGVRLDDRAALAEGNSNG